MRTPTPEGPPSEATTRILTGADGQPVALQIRAATAVVVSGPDAGRSAKIDKPVFRIGSGAGNDLTLTDPSVSRFHAAIEAADRGFVVRDLGSTNGTFVGHLRLGEVTVVETTALRLGRDVVELRPRAERYELALSPRQALEGLIGASPAMRQVFSQIEAYAPHPYNVLIEGESGTGKEEAARALHRLSGRPAEGWVVVDCGCLTRDLMEDELFGHVPGAFTGAARPRQGAFARAHGGTLFLDEVGELPLALQTRLLRVIQEREFAPLGSDQAQRSDFRLVAATNRDLAAEVNQGRFREDLFHRIASLRLRMPALRDRQEDIPLLLEHFLMAETAALGGPRGFGLVPPEVVRELCARPWSGNVRQLRNYVLRLVVRRSMGPLGIADYLGDAPAGEIGGEEVTLEASEIEAVVDGLGGPGNLYQQGKAQVLDAYDLAFARHFLARAGGVVAHAARLSGLHRQQLARILTRLDPEAQTLLKRR